LGNLHADTDGLAERVVILDTGSRELAGIVKAIQDQADDLARQTQSLESTAKTGTEQFGNLRADTDRLSVRIETLDSGTRELAGLFKAAQDRADDLAQQIHGLESTTKTTTQRLGNLHGDNDGLLERVDILDSGTRELAGLLKAVQDQTDGLTQKLESTTKASAEQFGKLRADTDGLTERAGILDAGTGELVTALKDIQGHTEPILQQIETLAESLHSTREQLNDLSQKAETLETGEQSTTEQLSALRTLMDDFSNQFNDMDAISRELKVEIADSKEMAQAMEQRVKPLEVGLETTNGQLERIGAQTESLENSADLHKEEYDSQTEQLKRLKEDGERLTARLDEIAASNEELNTATGVQQETVQNLTDRLESGLAQLGTRHDDQESRATDFERQINGWRATLDKTLSTFRKQLATALAGVAAAVLAAVLTYWIISNDVHNLQAERLPEINDIHTQITLQSKSLTDLKAENTEFRQSVAKLSTLKENQKEQQAELTSYHSLFEEHIRFQEGIDDHLELVDKTQESLREETGRLSLELDTLKKSLIEDREAKMVRRAARDTGLKSDEWLLAQEPGLYTIQIMGAHRKESVLAIPARFSLDSSTAYYRHSHDGQKWFVLLYGTFHHLDAARQALSDLPAPLQEFGPWIRRLGSIHKDLGK
ncbi:MAG: hypothetical protein GY731_03410, partial [Gammaproteobacteria bacterium]|nr:hypothetical protein [Gammaproteobacteria bacterium]